MFPATLAKVVSNNLLLLCVILSMLNSKGRGKAVGQMGLSLISVLDADPEKVLDISKTSRYCGRHNLTLKCVPADSEQRRRLLICLGMNHQGLMAKDRNDLTLANSGTLSYNISYRFFLFFSF